MYKTKNYISKKKYPMDSLCGGFIGDAYYEENGGSCRLPCLLSNKYNIISYQNYQHCKNISNNIIIDGEYLIAKSYVIVKQHIVSNRKYYIFIKELNKNEKTKIKSETFEVYNSKIEYERNNSKWYFHFIPKKIKTSSYGEKLSVHFIMLDGGSRYVTKHQLLHTTKYLQGISKYYSMYDMLKYHSIDFNSFSHFSALFYGIKFNTSDINNTNHRIIFEDYKEEKYITINAHLVCDVNERFYVNNNYSGSDHNLNPPSCDNHYKENIFSSSTRCLGDKQIHQHYFNYLKEALLYYHSKEQPVFLKLILMDSHDGTLESLPRIDIDFYKYLKYLNDNGIMNKSVIIITADHGIHYGKYFKTLIFPKSFTSKNKIISRNLFINQNRFVTAFDIHNTLLDLAHFNGYDKIKIYRHSRTTSLFERISAKRNCKNQGVRFGCSCKVGNKEYDDDNYNNTIIKVESIANPYPTYVYE